MKGSEGVGSEGEDLFCFLPLSPKIELLSSGEIDTVARETRWQTIHCVVCCVAFRCAVLSCLGLSCLVLPLMLSRGISSRHIKGRKREKKRARLEGMIRRNNHNTKQDKTITRRDKSQERDKSQDRKRKEGVKAALPQSKNWL